MIAEELLLDVLDPINSFTAHFHECRSHVGGAVGDCDSAFCQDALFDGDGVVFSSDDGTCMAYAAFWRHCGAGNESRGGFSQ